jgi:hypothetical protein
LNVPGMADPSLRGAETNYCGVSSQSAKKKQNHCRAKRHSHPGPS